MTTAVTPLALPPTPWTTWVARAAVPAVAVAALALGLSAGVALVLGVLIALTLGNPWPAQTRLVAQRSLTWSVIGLGAGMNLGVVARVGLHGFVYTAAGITCAFVLGTLLGRRLGVARDTSLLVTVGTAICGGSAIAAVAPVIRAKDHDVSMAMVVVFVLNGVALFVFPAIGHRLNLSQESFGLWCALAIHDTSSVVGASAQYGERALQVATAAKLARALWIIPVTFAVATLRARQMKREGGEASKVAPKRPWFIAGFVAMAALVTFVPSLGGVGHTVAEVARRALAVTLFLIGLGLSRKALQALGVRPFAQALGLWLAMGGGTLAAVMWGWMD